MESLPEKNIKRRGPCSLPGLLKEGENLFSVLNAFEENIPEDEVHEGHIVQGGIQELHEGNHLGNRGIFPYAQGGLGDKGNSLPGKPPGNHLGLIPFPYENHYILRGETLKDFPYQGY